MRFMEPPFRRPRILSQVTHRISTVGTRPRRGHRGRGTQHEFLGRAGSRAKVLGCTRVRDGSGREHSGWTHQEGGDEQAQVITNDAVLSYAGAGWVSHFGGSAGLGNWRG